VNEDPVKDAVLAAAQAAGLTLSAESEAAVVTNARLLAARFAEFADVPLPDSLDPAAVLKL
jgi:hypothetical protein